MWVCAVCCESVETVRLTRMINDSNVLCMGESIVAPDLACEMVDIFLSTAFQDAPAEIPEAVVEFWREPRDEFMARGPIPEPRDLEILNGV